MFESDPVYLCVSTCVRRACVLVPTWPHEMSGERSVFGSLYSFLYSLQTKLPAPFPRLCVLVTGCGNLDSLLQESSTPRGPSPKNAYREVALVRTGEALVPFKVRHPPHTLKIILLTELSSALCPSLKCLHTHTQELYT